MTLAEVLLGGGAKFEGEDGEGEDGVALFRFLAPSGPQPLTRAELRHHAGCLATKLRHEGLSGQPVLLLYPAGLDVVVALWGCLLAGAVAVPVSPPDVHRLASTVQRVQAIASDAGVRAVLTPPNLRRVLEPALGLDARWITDGGADFELAALPTPDAPALLQYTSGSTGRPRGARLLHRNLASNSAAIQASFDLGPTARAVTWLPPHHDMGLVGCLLQPVVSGVRITLMTPADFVRDPMRWLREMSAIRATHSVAPSFAYALCARRGASADLEELDLSAWRVAINGAEPVDAGALKHFAQVFGRAGFDGKAFTPCYGLAEATLVVTAGRFDREPALLQADAEGLRRGAVGPGDDAVLVGCGTPVADTEVAIATDGRRLPEGQVGEVLVRGPGVGTGYHPPQAENRAFFTELDGEAWLRTRDLGLLRGGELYLVGRSDDCMVVAGRNHYAHDIERCVAKASTQVRPGCVAAFGVELDGGQGVGVVAELKGEVVPSGVRAAISRALADECGLGLATLAFVAPQALPRTTSGKLRRFKARDRLATQRFELLPEAPVIPPGERRSGSEARAWTTVRSALAVLRPEHPNWPEDAPLEDLGLDSLAISDLLARVEDELGIGLSPGPYARITIGSLVAELAESLEASGSPT